MTGLQIIGGIFASILIGIISVILFVWWLMRQMPPPGKMP